MVERQLSPEEYLALKAEERLEYEEGRLLAMAGDYREHNLLLTRLLLRLFPLAEAQGCRLLHQTVRLKVAEDRYYYPDLMVVCAPPPQDPYLEEAPCLVAEVLSPSTEARDRGTKLRAYLALPSLQAYLLVDPKGLVEVYRKTEGGVLYEVHREGSILLDCPQGALDLREIFP
jgi:Uma2 family endonuclease